MTDYASEEQGILKEKNKEEKELDMEIGQADEDVYTQEGVEHLVEDGEISPEEAGFMQGAQGGGQLGKDALTGEPILGEAYEKEIDGKVYRFVSKENAEKFQP